MRYVGQEELKELKHKKKRYNAVFFVIFISVICVIAFSLIIRLDLNRTKQIQVSSLKEFNLEEVPDFTGIPYIEINGNKPWFDKDQKNTKAFEEYSDLDSLGRCGPAMANVCVELMPTEERGEIGMIKPSGWHTVKYDDIIEDRYLYNRCHLIAYSLTGENANEKNLITGTRFMNVNGMLPFEIQVANYIRDTNNHVLYRVTPVFNGKELVARGVIIEAWSVEDNGRGICFNVFCYNNQPRIKIDYTTGESRVE